MSCPVCPRCLSRYFVLQNICLSTVVNVEIFPRVHHCEHYGQRRQVGICHPSAQVGAACQHCVDAGEIPTEAHCDEAALWESWELWLGDCRWCVLWSRWCMGCRLTVVVSVFSTAYFTFVSFVRWCHWWIRFVLAGFILACVVRIKNEDGQKFMRKK